MGTKLIFQKVNNALVPADQVSEEWLQKVKIGQIVNGEFSRMRNYEFHKKIFALLNLAFEYFEPEQKVWRGVQVQKNFDRFREDVTILAGFFDAHYRIDGDVRLTAKSISFASMDEDEFHRVYDSVFNVLWERIFKFSNFKNEHEVENVISQMLSFRG